jgi:Chlorophyll A-B binding protein
MKTACVVLATLLASAAAFAPASQRQATSTTSALKAADGPFADEAGVLAPVGYFDPAKLSYGISEETFTQYRAAEKKHGRVAMLAVLGYVATETYHWPGEIAFGLKFADVPSGLAALSVIPNFGILQIIILVACIEKYGFLGAGTFGEAGLLNLTPDELKKRETQELQHGRLAMLATMELFRHDAQTLIQPGFDGEGVFNNLITGLPFIYN